MVDSTQTLKHTSDEELCPPLIEPVLPDFVDLGGSSSHSQNRHASTCPHFQNLRPLLDPSLTTVFITASWLQRHFLITCSINGSSRAWKVHQRCQHDKIGNTTHGRMGPLRRNITRYWRCKAER